MSCIIAGGGWDIFLAIFLTILTQRNVRRVLAGQVKEEQQSIHSAF
jgi:hypothetical protein